MTDFHHNIFYFYRGATLEDYQSEKQLEDNTTKALINTLEHCTQSVAHIFLNWLGVKDNGKIRFELQRKTVGDAKIKEKSQRFVLGLIPSGRNSTIKEDSIYTKYDSRPDAWIYGDDYVVLVRSKVVGSLSLGQLQKT